MIECRTRKRGYLIDLDGTLISGRTVLPDARRLLEMVRGRFVIVSNNAEHTPRQLARQLHGMGLSIDEGSLVLAGTLAIDTVAVDRPGAAILLLGSPGLRAYARNKGLRLDAARPDVVMVMRDRQFSYAKLARAAEALSDGAYLVVAAPDGSHPGPDGKPVPETGALAAAILACVAPRDYTVIGKPERAMFDVGCQRLGLTPAETVMIGDNPQTDGLGARRTGMAFHHVRDGLLGLPSDLIVAWREIDEDMMTWT